jgi:membrane protein YdbS with pleckstrin-like domain
MEQLVEGLTRGNVTEVKVVLASVAAALAVYQVVLIAIGYGKLRPRVLEARSASWTHRASGDAILVLIAVVSLFCLGYFGLDDDGAVHAITGAALVVVLALKVAVIRWWHGLGRFLPVLGTLVVVLLAATWFTSAGHFLADGEG